MKLRKVVRDVGVDSGTIMISDVKFYTNLGGSIDSRLTNIIKVPIGKYRVEWKIKEAWNGPIKGSGTVNNESGEVAVTDPCYGMPHSRWSKLLDETDYLKNEPEGTIVIDEMGGDGTYIVHLDFKKIG